LKFYFDSNDRLVSTGGDIQGVIEMAAKIDTEHDITISKYNRMNYYVGS
jgi:hypothetical protein